MYLCRPLLGQRHYLSVFCPLPGWSVGRRLHVSGRTLCHPVFPSRNSVLPSDETETVSKLWGSVRLNRDTTMMFLEFVSMAAITR